MAPKFFEIKDVKQVHQIHLNVNISGNSPGVICQGSKIVLVYILQQKQVPPYSNSLICTVIDQWNDISFDYLSLTQKLELE